MMNNDMLANIEYLREKADVSYEEAERILEQNEGNVMRALVELERQGRVYGQTRASDEPVRGRQQDAGDCDGMNKTKSFLQKAFATRLVVEKNVGDAEPLPVANVPAPFAVVAAFAAPWLVVGTGVAAIVSGHGIRLEKAETKDAEDA